MRRLGSAVAILVFLTALVAAISFYTEDRAARRPIEQHIERFDLETRRPDVVKTVGYAPSADWASDVVADAAMRDAYEPIDLSHMTPEERAAWVRSMMNLSDELHSARDLLLGRFGGVRAGRFTRVFSARLS
jgi:hypothetical protein